MADDNEVDLSSEEPADGADNSLEPVSPQAGDEDFGPVSYTHLIELVYCLYVLVCHNMLLYDPGFCTS